MLLARLPSIPSKNNNRDNDLSSSPNEYFADQSSLLPLCPFLSPRVDVSEMLFAIFRAVLDVSHES